MEAHDPNCVANGLIFCSIFIVPFIVIASKARQHMELRSRGVKTRARVLNNFVISDERGIGGYNSGTYSFEAPKSESTSEMGTFTHDFTGQGEKGTEIEIRYLARNPKISETEESLNNAHRFIYLLGTALFGTMVLIGLYTAVAG